MTTATTKFLRGLSCLIFLLPFSDAHAKLIFDVGEVVVDVSNLPATVTVPVTVSNDDVTGVSLGNFNIATSVTNGGTNLSLTDLSDPLGGSVVDFPTALDGGAGFGVVPAGASPSSLITNSAMPFAIGHSLPSSLFVTNGIVDFDFIVNAQGATAANAPTIPAGGAPVTLWEYEFTVDSAGVQAGDFFPISILEPNMLPGSTDVSVFPTATLEFGTEFMLMDGEIRVVPEPTALSLIGLALAGLIAVRRRR